MSFSSLTTQGVNDLFKKFVDASGSNKSAVFNGACGTFAVLGGLYAFSTAISNRDGYAKGKKITEYKKFDAETIYDVAVVGAGPSGSTLGYYLCRNNQPYKVLLLDKKKFPRDKYCGDAVCTVAQNHLREMGVLQEIVAEKKGHFAQAGGFVSPGGYSYIGNSAVELNLDNGGTAIAIKRIVMDEKIAKASQKAGALLTENTNVENATFNKETGLWKVECRYTGDDENSNGEPRTYYARVLVCADGAASGLATKLGYVSGPPQGICSRAYVKDNTQFKVDGCVFYTPQLLPGYCAIFREAGNELNFCTYIIPGGPAKNEDLPALHDDIMKNDPYVSACLGPNPNIERMRSAGLRLGGIDKSWDDHLMIIGDAAGFIDPLTGEGIQYAMQSGWHAAEVLREALQKGDVSSSMMKKYHRRWYREWGLEFKLSMKVSLMLYRFPIILDSTVNLIKKKGAKFFADWAEVMTGSKSKSYFLRLDVWPYVLIELATEVVKKALGQKTPLQKINESITTN